MAVELITNRTQDDVAYWSDLRQAIINRTATAAQWREWLGGIKGAYTAADLNRVGRAMIEIAALVTELYRPVSVSPKINWTVSDIPTLAQMKHYLDDIEAIRSVISGFDFLPSTPTTMNHLTYQMANDIEGILLIARESVIQIGDIFIQSGMYQSGFVYFFKYIDPNIERVKIFIQSGQVQSGNQFFPISTIDPEIEASKIYIQSGTIQSGFNEFFFITNT